MARRLLAPLNCALVILLVIAIGAGVAARYFFFPRDVTNSASLNGGYIAHGTYVLQCRVVICDCDGMDSIARYWATPADPDYVAQYVINPKTGAINAGFSFLEAGARLQLEKIIWFPAEIFADGGGHTHPYARVLDGPNKGTLLFIRDISTDTEIRAGSDGELLLRTRPEVP